MNRMAAPRLPDQAQHLEQQFLALNTRIARLCLLLGVRLDSQADVQRLLGRQLPAFQPAKPADTLNQAQRREHQEWEELRGLVAMRCDLVSHTLQHLGLELTRQLTDLAEQDLQRLGFKPGADGFELLRHLDDPT
ncbi:MAG: hypothetical protein RLZZ555_430 [Pseudomonadota bacterium]|jgi:hypothetical protein